MSTPHDQTPTQVEALEARIRIAQPAIDRLDAMEDDRPVSEQSMAERFGDPVRDNGQLCTWEIKSELNSLRITVYRGTGTCYVFRFYGMGRSQCLLVENPTRGELLSLLYGLRLWKVQATKCPS